MVLESISDQNKNSDRQKERFRSPIGIGVGVTIIYNSFVRVCKHFCSLKVLYRIGNYHEMHLPRKQK